MQEITKETPLSVILECTDLIFLEVKSKGGVPRLTTSELTLLDSKLTHIRCALYHQAFEGYLQTRKLGSKASKTFSRVCELQRRFKEEWVLRFPLVNESVITSQTQYIDCHTGYLKRHISRNGGISGVKL